MNLIDVLGGAAGGVDMVEGAVLRPAGASVSRLALDQDGALEAVYACETANKLSCVAASLTGGFIAAGAALRVSAVCCHLLIPPRLVGQPASD